jgi:segregation and condensation protein B
VIITGRNEDAVGKPLIYATSKSFMDYFGINSAEDLPKISEVLMDELIQATNVKEAEENMYAETANESKIPVEATVEEEIIANEDAIEAETETEVAVTESIEIIEEVNNEEAADENNKL